MGLDSALLVLFRRQGLYLPPVPSVIGLGGTSTVQSGLDLPALEGFYGAFTARFISGPGISLKVGDQKGYYQQQPPWVGHIPSWPCLLSSSVPGANANNWLREEGAIHASLFHWRHNASVCLSITSLSSCGHSLAYHLPHVPCPCASLSAVPLSPSWVGGGGERETMSMNILGSKKPLCTSPGLTPHPKHLPLPTSVQETVGQRGPFPSKVSHLLPLPVTKPH